MPVFLQCLRGTDYAAALPTLPACRCADMNRAPHGPNNSLGCTNTGLYCGPNVSSPGPYSPWTAPVCPPHCQQRCRGPASRHRCSSPVWPASPGMPHQACIARHSGNRQCQPANFSVLLWWLQIFGNAFIDPFATTAGTWYYVIVSGWQNATKAQRQGPFALNIY